MKARELMIGDLVIFEDCVHKITDLSLCIDGTVLVHVDGLDCHIFEHEIHAITLTEEILKTNGFEEKTEHARYNTVFYGLFVGNVSISFEVDNGLPILTIEDTADRSKQHNIICLKDEVYNVHELQRVLRCCGLWDMAEKFKIN